jgi:hypothetical protein
VRDGSSKRAAGAAAHLRCARGCEGDELRDRGVDGDLSDAQRGGRTVVTVDDVVAIV